MPYPLLNKQEIEQLSRYRLKLDAAGETVDYLSIADPEQLPDVLDRLTRRLEAPNACVTASILTKRLAFYAVIHLYAMTVLGKRLRVDLREFKLVDESREELWLPVFDFGNFSIEEPVGSRTKWRAQIVEHVFGETLSPVIRRLKEQTRLKESIMWENTALYVHWIYNQISAIPDLRRLAMDDLHYIFHEAPASAFGASVENPLTAFAGTAELGRSTCCLSYMLKTRNCCNGCPIAPRVQS
ncbi:MULTISPECIES: IucA/IucC family C-terminal-domain containing protein [Bhargavaea]|uniref:IucA/IucC family C-terminal-domain containing protein n=1 Tax=Bhargavaea changchunensis TaxID=2134037 RepID=A0ABW2NH47_9BACL|nr:IucA/IucC family C-terminal-domain containing protein [Bhargavaea sp. CC-171006]